MTTTMRPEKYSGNGAGGDRTSSDSRLDSLRDWPPIAARRPIRWSVVYALFKYWTWQAVTKVVLGIIYLAVIAEGFRLIMPALGQKLYRLPGLGWVRDYEATHRLDLANFFSIFMLVAVWYLWGMILSMWLRFDGAPDEGRLHGSRIKSLIISLGLVILLADAFLFYSAMVQMGWASTAFSFEALVATAAYLAMLVFVTFVGLVLHQNVVDRKEESQ